MPILRNRTVFEIARGVKAFLNLEAGVTRSGEVPGLWPGDARAGGGPARRARRELARKDRELAGPRTKLAGKDGAAAGGIRAENVVWIFGFGRSGSTWLSFMMGELKDHTVWQEPLVGMLFGDFYYAFEPLKDAHHKRPSFILGSQKKNWLGPMRTFFLEGATIRFPQVRDTGILVVKEPNGSFGAPLLMEALPECRMVLLIRDPRDVMASFSYALRKGGWTSDLLGAENLPDFDAEVLASKYLQVMGNAKQAYEAHEGHKVLVRYEDLRADSLETMKRIYSALEVTVDEEELVQAVEKHSWENIPEDEKGPEKFCRKATSGGWGEDLTAEQVETIEKITAPLLKEFYS